MFDNLLSSPGLRRQRAAAVPAAADPGHGLPARLPHRLPDARATRGSPTRTRAEEEATRLGIHVPFDDNTPLSAYGSMFIARPADAARDHARRGYRHEDFPDETRLRRRRAHPRGRAAGQLCGAQHRAPLPRGHERRARGDQLLLPRVPRHRASARSCPAYPRAQIKRISKLKRIREAGDSGIGIVSPSAKAGRRQLRHEDRGRATPAARRRSPPVRTTVTAGRRGDGTRRRRASAPSATRSAAGPTASASSAGCWPSR